MAAAFSNARLDALRSAPLDSWVALSEDESKIVAVGASYGEVVAGTDKIGITDPVILKTPKEWLPFSV